MRAASWAVCRGSRRTTEFVVAGGARAADRVLRVNMRITDCGDYRVSVGRPPRVPSGRAGPDPDKITAAFRASCVLALQEASRRAAIVQRGRVWHQRVSGARQVSTRAPIAPSIPARAALVSRAGAGPAQHRARLASRTCQQLVSNPWWGDPRAIAAAADLGREAVAIALALAPGHAFAEPGVLPLRRRTTRRSCTRFEQALAMDQASALPRLCRLQRRP
jgi:hypothetical protein